MERRLELIGEMTPAIWVHLIAAVAALLVGALVLWRRKGDRRHRLAGRAWVGLMLVVALSSFLIREQRDGEFSPIHILSVVTLASLASGLLALRSADRARGVRNHHRTMQSLYAFALLIAGGFTFLPERLLGRLVTEAGTVPHMLIAGGMIGGGIVMLVRSYRPRHDPAGSTLPSPAELVRRRK